MHLLCALRFSNFTSLCLTPQSPPLEQDIRDVERAHVGKMRAWLSDHNSMRDLILWTAVAAPVEHLHYSLFQVAALHGHKAKGKTIWAFSQRGSLPMRVVDDLSRSFQCTQPAHTVLWRLPIAMLGEAEAWPTDVLVRALAINNLTLGNLWRRFKLRLAAFPLALANIVHPETPVEDQLALAEAFVAKPACCLDDDYSLKLRGLLNSARDLLDDAVIASFLRSSLEGLVGSASHIEDGFAHMRRALQAAHRPPGMCSLSSQQTLSEHRRVHAKWKDSQRPESLKPAPKQAANKRPVWAATKKQTGRSECNSFQEFVSSNYALASSRPGLERLSKSDQHAHVLKHLGQAWRDLSQDERSRLSFTHFECRRELYINVADSLHQCRVQI